MVTFNNNSNNYNILIITNNNAKVRNVNFIISGLAQAVVDERRTRNPPIGTLLLLL